MRLIRYRTILPALVLVCRFASAQTDAVPKERDRAPDFSIATGQGKRISLITSHGGLLVLNFWETSCVPCVAELPSLSAFARRFRSKRVVVVAVSGDEDPEKYSRFLRDHRIVLDTYRDPTRGISKSFGTLDVPRDLRHSGRPNHPQSGGRHRLDEQRHFFVRPQTVGTMINAVALLLFAAQRRMSLVRSERRRIRASVKY
jgi:peroxiredoxin